MTIARSRSLWGEYESCKNNPILTNRHDTVKEIRCSGHGDLFQDHRGNWWMVHLGIRTARRTMSHLGRETFLTHILWEDGWPSMGDGKMEMLEKEGPLWEEQKRNGYGRRILERLHGSRSGFLYAGAETAFSAWRWKIEHACFQAEVRPGDRFCVCSSQTVGLCVYHRDRISVLSSAYRDEAGMAIYLESGFHYRFREEENRAGRNLLFWKKPQRIFNRPPAAFRWSRENSG